MPPAAIHKTQAAVTSLFLNKMGYQRHMPRAVVYAPATVGGLDFRHLGFEQGVQQTLQLVKHMRAASTNGSLYRSLIDAYQIHSGLPQPILEDTRTLPWSSPGWMTSIRQFLQDTGTKILLSDPWTPRPRRINDRNIMEDALEFLPSNTNLCALNNVRLYLHVTFLSEITDASGNFIREDYLHDMIPATASTLRWPYQIAPLPENWKIWRNAILQLYTKGSDARLAQPLTSWHQEAAFTNWTWEWRIDPNTYALYHYIQNHWMVQYPTRKQRTYIEYHGEAHRTTRLPLPFFPPATPTIDTHHHLIRVNLPIHQCVSSYPTPLPPPDNLLERLCTPPEPWAERLWHRVRPQQALDMLLTAITNK